MLYFISMSLFFVIECVLDTVGVICIWYTVIKWNVSSFMFKIQVQDFAIGLLAFIRLLLYRK